MPSNNGNQEPSPETSRKRDGFLSTAFYALAVAACVCLLLTSSLVAGGFSFLIPGVLGWEGVPAYIGAAISGFLGAIIGSPAGIALLWLFLPDPAEGRSLLRTFTALFITLVGITIYSGYIFGAAIMTSVMAAALFYWLPPSWASLALALVAPLMGFLAGFVVGDPTGEANG